MEEGGLWWCRREGGGLTADAGPETKTAAQQNFNHAMEGGGGGGGGLSVEQHRKQEAEAFPKGFPVTTGTKHPVTDPTGGVWGGGITSCLDYDFSHFWPVH